MRAYALAFPAAGLSLAVYFFPGQMAAAVSGLAPLALILLTCAGFGRLLLKAFVRSHLSGSERTLIGCTLGLGALSQGMFLLGALGLLRPWAVGFLMAAAWVVSFTEMREMAQSLRPNRNLLQGRGLWAAGIGLLLALPLWCSFVPPHSYDALVYHLSLPDAYLRAGRITVPEHIIYSHFPQNAEMLFALGLALGSDVAAQLMSWLATALSVWWVFELGKREMPLNAALAACVLVASQTATMLVSSIAYVETITMLWITATLLCFLRWRELPEEGDGWLALSAVFAGLAVGTKYIAGVTPAAVALYLAARRRWRPLALFTAVAAAAGSPWLIKNWVVVGNPVFPFLYKWLPYRGPGWGGENAAGYFAFFRDYGHAPGELLKDLVQLPFLVATGSSRFGGGADVLGSLGWQSLLLLVPLAGLAARRNGQIAFLAAYCVYHVAIWFTTGVVLRYLVVIVPVWAIAAAAGLDAFWSKLAKPGRTAVAGGLVLLGVLQLGLFLHVHTLLGSWDVLLAVQTRREYLARRLDYYPCAAWSGEHLPKNVRMLIVGDQRGYFLERDHTATTVMAPNRFVVWANEAKDAASLSRRLRQDGGYTHLLLVPREAERIAPYGPFAFTDAGRANWEALESGGAEVVHRDRACAVLALRS
ncbi:MAG: glycosyltransferase family 39 protein [Elusimicrobia bacterium]|nr:glycosyltransferase family 39 protein [Elusimicrobiota bacterium]